VYQFIVAEEYFVSMINKSTHWEHAGKDTARWAACMDCTIMFNASQRVKTEMAPGPKRVQYPVTAHGNVTSLLS
jgi:hypothetical protein